MAFWFRWAWRDLGSRLVQVVAIALIVALGSGIYAGLGSTSVWRRVSLDASFTRLNAHDVHIAGIGGLTTGPDQLTAAVRSAGGASIGDVETRLVADLPIRAGVDGELAAAGELVGVDLQSADRIDRWQLTGGSDLAAGDSQTVLLDDHFARAHGLPSSGTIQIAGTTVRYVGTALGPEYLNTNVTFGATIQGAATRAIVYAPIGLVQQLAGRPGQVNDAVVRTQPGADPSAVAASLTSDLPALLPELPVTVTAHRDDPLVQALYGEIRSEQRIFDVFALLILAGAGFATFNLTRRVVESQRRDIGIAMSLGVRPRDIAIRPLVMGAQIAVAGVMLGLVAGWGLGTWVLTIIRGQMPLPIWLTPWQAGLFAQSAALGLLIPLAGTAYPVWRAIRVPPTDALLAPHLRSRRGGLPLLRRVSLPGGTLFQAPLRRLTASPTRSAMTFLAVGLILAPLFAALGITDSATATIEQASDTGNRSDQLLVNMTSYQPVGSPEMTAVSSSPLASDHAFMLNTGGFVERGSASIGVSISMVDLSDPLVVPAGLAERKLPPGGIVLSSKAASDLGVVEGGEVVLRHPVREGLSYRFTATTVPVRAVVDIPYRFVAYMSIEDASLMGLDGIVNAVTLVPGPGVSMDQLQESIASSPGVAWALSAHEVGNTIRQVLSLVSGLFVILQIVIGLLAFLVAYNSVKVGHDERARESATMMAFGVTVRRVVAIGVAESLMLGIVAVGVGLAVGYGLFRWILESVLPAAIPDLAVHASINGWSYGMTVIIGLAAMAVAPIMVVRQLRRMNLPSALRYVE